MNMLHRRALLALPALLISSPPLALHAATAVPPFELRVPPEFLSLPPRDASTLLVAGNFATATTLSVQRVEAATLRKFVGGDITADSLAAAFAAYRDREAAPSGAKSTVLPGSVQVDASSGKVSFEMLLALASQPSNPDLSRRTAVVAIPDGTSGCWFVCWAGAKVSSWNAGDGVLLQQAAQTFALRAS